MELNEMEKKLLFQVEGDYQTKILNELYMTVRYSNNSEQREAAEGLMAKLRVLSNAECMDLVKDIQKNYRLPYPARTIGEKIAEARQQSGAEKLKGHDIMALERFDPEVKHMIVFDVLSYDSPVGDKGDKMRLFLTDAGYQKFLESQERGEVKLKTMRRSLTVISIMTAGIMPCNGIVEERRRYNGSIPCRENKGLYDNEQSPSAQYGVVLKGKGAFITYVVAAGRLGLYHKGTRPYLQGWCGFYHYCPEGTGAAWLSHQTAPPL